MAFGTDDPNVQELLARNAQFDLPQPPQGSTQLPFVGLAPQPAQQAQKPGGIKALFAQMAGGMADAAMKESTGMNFAERQLAQQEIQARQLQNQYAPAEHQAKLNALTAQPRFDPDSGQFLGVMNDNQYTQYLRGQGAAKIKARSALEVEGEKGKNAANVADIAGKYKVQAAMAKPSEIQLIARAQGGDTEAQKILDTLQTRRTQQAAASGAARGRGYGYYRPQMYYDPELGQEVPMFAGDAMNAVKNGQKLIPSGPVSSNVLLGFQRLNSEATPAIQGVRQNIGAFDNANDRAVFARVMKENPMGDGDPHTWLGNVLDQALKGGLSPQGQQVAIKLNRLNETLNLLRTTIGAPSTNSAMAIALKLVPGPSTPNSKYAAQQLNELEQIVKQANVPMVGGSAETHLNGGKGSPPPGAKVRDFSHFFK